MLRKWGRGKSNVFIVWNFWVVMDRVYLERMVDVDFPIICSVGGKIRFSRSGLGEGSTKEDWERRKREAFGPVEYRDN